MAEYLVQDTSLTAVADAIRAKTGSADSLAFPTGMVNAISGISGGENLDEELATQGELIEQIFTAIEGKVGGGGGGVDGGYSVTFNAETGETVAMFSVLPGVGIQAPVCSVRNWEDEAGDLILFPYTPNGSIVLRPVPPAISDDLYAFYGLDVGEYPYLMIWVRNSNESKIYFAKSTTNDGYGFSGDVYYGTASMSGVDISDADAVAEACRTALPSLSSLTRTTGITGPYDGNGMYFYTNYDLVVSSGTFARID